LSLPLSHLRKYNLILGSGSPRRKELLDMIWPEYQVIKSDVEEIIPAGLPAEQAPAYLAELKADDLVPRMPTDYLLITADTVVIHNQKILGEPVDRADAISMLTDLAAGQHEVISGVCIKTATSSHTFSDTTTVEIEDMTQEEISYYVDNFEVMDKAGSYGIQDWLGVTKVRRLDGSYYNVMGLPADMLYKYLLAL